MHWLYKDTEFKRKDWYYKHILLFVNPNSGKKKAPLIFSQCQRIFEANGIRVDSVVT